jgi:hypothetical protein
MVADANDGLHWEIKATIRLTNRMNAQRTLHNSCEWNAINQRDHRVQTETGIGQDARCMASEMAFTRLQQHEEGSARTASASSIRIDSRSCTRKGFDCSNDLL